MKFGVAMRKRLQRWALATGLVGAMVFGPAGTLRDPWLWAYVGVCSAAACYAMFSMDEDLAKERFRPPTSGADAVALRFVRGAALLHVMVGALDTGRWHLAPTPPLLRVASLVAMGAAM